MLPLWTIKENSHRQRHQVQKETMDTGIRQTKNRTEIHTHLFTTVQRKNRRIPQVPQSYKMNGPKIPFY